MLAKYDFDQFHFVVSELCPFFNYAVVKFIVYIQ